MAGRNVLIVDDSSVMRKIVARSLAQAGLAFDEVLEAGNGAEALEIAKVKPLALILSDINMPGMDGLEFVRQLRGVETAKGVPVVMITTEGGEKHVVQAISEGARGYIRKPFTADQIKERVVPLLGA
jgi:two-component system, chemotaxis family, chemotaxis protein CheY